MPKLIPQEPSEAWKGAALTRLNMRMTAFLTQIHSIAGVESSFVFDNNGVRLTANVDANANIWQWTFRGDESKLFGLSLAQMLAAIQLRDTRPGELELYSARTCLYARSLGNAFGVVLCRPNVDWSFLRMTVNVEASAIEADDELQRSLSSVAPRLQVPLTPDLLADADKPLIRKIMSSNQNR